MTQSGHIWCKSRLPHGTFFHFKRYSASQPRKDYVIYLAPGSMHPQAPSRRIEVGRHVRMVGHVTAASSAGAHNDHRPAVMHYMRRADVAFVR